MVQLAACFQPLRDLCQCVWPLHRQATYFPNRYFRRMVVHYMVNHWQQIFENKFLALMSLYGIEEEADSDRGWTPPLVL